jgi:hypothetical protein
MYSGKIAVPPGGGGIVIIIPHFGIKCSFQPCPRRVYIAIHINEICSPLEEFSVFLLFSFRELFTSFI